MYVKSFGEFEKQGEIIFKENPNNARLVTRYDHSRSSLILKVTDDRMCVMYKVQNDMDMKKVEKFIDRTMGFVTDCNIFY